MRRKPLLNWLRHRGGTRDSAHALYLEIVARARTPEFYGELGVPDTLDGRFDMIVLHMFLVLERLRRDGEAGRRLSQALFDLMFQDMDRSLRELGVSDHAIGRRIKQMVSAFYGRVRAYEEAAEDPDAVAAAVRRNIFRERPVDPEVTARLAGYILESRRRLAAAPPDRLLSGEFGFAGLRSANAPERR